MRLRTLGSDSDAGADSERAATPSVRIRPERRTRGDLAIVVAIVMVVALVAAAVWWASTSRRASDDFAAAPLPSVDTATSAPAGFTSGWQAASADTASTVVTNSAVVTADDGTVAGHDPGSGDVRWSYHRADPLCGVIGAYTSSPRVVAVYRNSRGCSEVTALDASDGRRAATRASAADSSITLSAGSDYVVSQGDSRLESWGSTMVRGVEYGRVSAPVKPGTQPRSGCVLLSSATGADQIAVIERCGDEPGYRLTIIAAAQDKDEKVDESGSRLITSGTTEPPPRVVAVSSSAVAVYVGASGPLETDRGPQLQVYGMGATLTSSHEVLGDPTPPADSHPQMRDGLLSYYTGKSTIILDASALTPTYQVPGTLGPAALMGRDLLVPGPTGITILDPATGRQIRTIAVDRPGYRSGTITLAPIGNDVAQLYGGRIHMLLGT